ncbi:hypothetical protein VNI00_003820 [Paramarasmius palmivorus]|uniref:Uncharacterized protein n=1 Tax=Paramarasmius palmivorus TaxID=297713 RepID=A0AAW0DPW5_9AGAR
MQYAHNVPKLLKGRFELRTQRKNRKEQHWVMGIEEARGILEAAPGMRRLIVNDDEFLGSWVLNKNSVPTYVVEVM